MICQALYLMLKKGAHSLVEGVGYGEHIGCSENIKERPEAQMGGIKEGFLKEAVADRC